MVKGINNYIRSLPRIPHTHFHTYFFYGSIYPISICKQLIVQFFLSGGDDPQHCLYNEEHYAKR